MPIARIEFKKLELLGPTLEEAVLGFLENNYDSAYTAMEIATENFQNEMLRNPNFPQFIRAMLESLRARKLVEGRLAQTSAGPEFYYAIP